MAGAFDAFRFANNFRREVIVHCKANPDIRVIDAIATILKDERVARGIEMK